MAREALSENDSSRAGRCSDAFQRGSIEFQDLRVHKFSLFDDSSVVHGTTTRTARLPLHGNMSFLVGHRGDLVLENRRAWAHAIGYDWTRLVLARQVHETTVATVDECHAGRGAKSFESAIARTDALITQTTNLPIGVMAADCVPILMHDPITGSVAAVHAGWRGTVDGIVIEALEAMRGHFGSRSDDLLVGLGPSICVSCYQVGDEVIGRWRDSPFDDASNVVVESSDGPFFDLREANLVQLAGAGVSHENIEVSETCTRCSDGEMFSRRGLGPKTGLFASVIMLRDASTVGDGPTR